MEEYLNSSKVLNYTDGKNLRELLLKANELNIRKEDIVSILPGKDCYYMVYYYGEVQKQGVL